MAMFLRAVKAGAFLVACSIVPTVNAAAAYLADTCPNGAITQVIVSETIVNYPVIVDTVFTTATVYVVCSDLTINISEYPTSVSISTYDYSTVRSTETCVTPYSTSALQSFVTSTSYLPPTRSGFSSTVLPSGSTPGTIIVGVPETEVRTTSYLNPTQSGYTSTVLPSGSVPGTIIIAVPETEVTSTIMLSANQTAYTSTVLPSGSIPGTVIIGAIAYTTTKTSYLDPTKTGYTSTVPQSGSVPGTIIISTPETVITTTITISGPGYASTVPPTGSNPGTVIVGTPASTTPIPPPVATCNNAGLGYAVQPHSYSKTNAIVYDFFKTDAPVQQGTTKIIGVDLPSGHPNIAFIYGGAALDVDQVAINHRGYFYPQTSGVYTFTIPRSDDITLFWLGAVAVSAYELDNALIVQNYDGAGETPLTATKTLIAGIYYPLRILGVNIGGAYVLGLTITAPDGTQILSGTTVSGSPDIVQFSCDGILAPAFPPFGAEIPVVVLPPVCVETPGFSYSIYRNPFIRISNNAPYSNFDPGYFSQAESIANGVYAGSLTFSLPTIGPQTVYSSSGIIMSQITMSVEGSLYSKVDQTLTFTPGAFDILYVWVGANAISGYSVDNFNAISLGGIVGTLGQGNTIFSLAVTGGSYTPYRFVWGSALEADLTDDAINNFQITGSIIDPTFFAALCPGDASSTFPIK